MASSLPAVRFPEGLHMAQRATSEDRILAAIANVNTNVSTVSTTVTGLGLTVARMGESLSNMKDQLTAVARKVDNVEEVKASRSDLKDTEGRFDKTVSDLKVLLSRDLTRLSEEKISKVDFDVASFSNMYDSLTDEMKNLDLKIDAILGIKQTVDGHSELLKDIKNLPDIKAAVDAHTKSLSDLAPIRDTYLKILGAKAVIAIGGSVLGSGITLLILKFIFHLM